MDLRKAKLLGGAALLALTVMGGLAWAGSSGPWVDGEELIPVWDGLYAVDGISDDGGLELADGCVLHAGGPERSGWYRGPVTVDCTALVAAQGGDLIAYSLGFGDWAESEAGSFTINDDGVHWVQVQSRTADGTAGLPSTFTVAIDTTPPTLHPGALPAGALSHADQLTLAFDAEDEVSGVEQVAAELDSEQELPAGFPIDLWELPLGYHTLTLTARDHAGNVAALDQPVELEITVDLPSLMKLVRVLSDRGKIDGYAGARQELLGHLAAAAAATAAADQRAGLEAFVEAVQDGMAQGQVSADAGAVLLSDARHLIGQLDDDSGWDW